MIASVYYQDGTLVLKGPVLMLMLLEPSQWDKALSGEHYGALAEWFSSRSSRTV